MPLPDATGYKTKRPVLGRGHLFWSCCSVGFHRPLSVIGINISLGTWWWDPTHLSHRTWRTQADADLEASSLVAGFHSTRRCYSQFEDRKVLNSLTQLWTLWATTVNSLAEYAYWHNTCMNTMGVTNHFIIGFKSHCTRLNQFLLLLTGK